jgi:hypothetical protein
LILYVKEIPNELDNLVKDIKNKLSIHLKGIEGIHKIRTTTVKDG